MPAELQVPTKKIEVDHKVSELLKWLGLGSEDRHAKHKDNDEVLERKLEFKKLLKRFGLDAASSKYKPLALSAIKKFMLF